MASGYATGSSGDILPVQAADVTPTSGYATGSSGDNPVSIANPAATALQTIPHQNDLLSLLQTIKVAQKSADAVVQMLPIEIDSNREKVVKARNLLSIQSKGFNEWNQKFGKFIGFWMTNTLKYRNLLCKGVYHSMRVKDAIAAAPDRNALRHGIISYDFKTLSRTAKSLLEDLRKEAKDWASLLVRLEPDQDWDATLSQFMQYRLDTDSMQLMEKNREKMVKEQDWFTAASKEWSECLSKISGLQALRDFLQTRHEKSIDEVAKQKDRQQKHEDFADKAVKEMAECGTTDVSFFGLFSWGVEDKSLRGKKEYANMLKVLANQELEHAKDKQQKMENTISSTTEEIEKQKNLLETLEKAKNDAETQYEEAKKLVDIDNETLLAQQKKFPGQSSADIRALADGMSAVKNGHVVQGHSESITTQQATLQSTIKAKMDTREEAIQTLDDVWSRVDDFKRADGKLDVEEFEDANRHLLSEFQVYLSHEGIDWTIVIEEMNKLHDQRQIQA